MPTLGSHYSDDTVRLVKAAVKASGEKGPGPYITGAVLQRLEREGFISGSAAADIRSIALATAEVVGERRVFEVLEQVKKEALAEQAAKVS